MMFVFDYGDFWEFTIECIGESDLDSSKEYPLILESHGDSPEQYSDYDEENNEDSEEDDDDFYDDEDGEEDEEIHGSDNSEQDFK